MSWPRSVGHRASRITLRFGRQPLDPRPAGVTWRRRDHAQTAHDAYRDHHVVGGRAIVRSSAGGADRASRHCDSNAKHRRDPARRLALSPMAPLGLASPVLALAPPPLLALAASRMVIAT